MRPCAGPRLCPAAMALRPHPVRAAQGFVLVSALSGVLMVVLILVAVWSQLAASHVEAQQDARRARLVGQAQAALLVWLRRQRVRGRKTCGDGFLARFHPAR